MYNLALRGHDIFPVETPEELATQVKNYGIHNIQFALNASFPNLPAGKTEINPGMGTYFQQLFAKNEIQIALLSCYSNLIHPEPEKREEILQKFEAYLHHAAFFGAAMVASETGSVMPELGYTEENFADEVFEDLVAVIQRLVSTGEQCRTLVGIEAGLNHPLCSIQRTKELVSRIPSPYLGIILDPTNLITVETAASIVALVQEAFEAYGARICALHLKDFVIKNKQIIPVPLGEGLIDYQKILKIGNQYKPYCYIVLEETTNENILRACELVNK